MLDQFYTPNNLADRLVSYLRTMPKLACDFCAGGGELLRACEDRFPDVKCLAVDKSKEATRKLKQSYPKWRIHTADFLSDKQISGITKGFLGGFDLILMNPPFSCKGPAYNLKIDGYVFKAQKALRFLFRALRFLSPNGHLLAILPAGTLHSQRDAQLVDYLKVMYKVRVLGHVAKASFSGKMPNVILIDISIRDNKHKYVLKTKKVPLPTYIYRGKCNIVKAKEMFNKCHDEKSCVRYVHTTNLIEGSISEVDLYLPTSKVSILYGPAVLLPRVGNPSLAKLVVINDGECYALSDCVMAILCRSNVAALTVRKRIFENRVGYTNIYQGTGARYTTVLKLDDFIKRIIDIKGFCRNRDQ